MLLALAGTGSACSPADSKQEVSYSDVGAVQSADEAASASTVEAGNSGGSMVNIQDAEDIIITGNGSTQTRTATGQDIQVLGNDNKTTFKGQCQEFYVVGNGNVIELENVASIQVTGDNNRVKWYGKEPTVNNLGKGNVLESAGK
ncbi:Protein of unknown function [Hymenobacter actinosclerus]|uniref:DUF3060 domain-containing protein n=2 Tax=Hymenobacter actinosclerus TaxID=82805 RepID=A0A1I0BFQ8_9BACT|nr:Protein of unknown function [Hymenobacter actinosclerus]